MTSQASQEASELFCRFPRHHQHGRGGNHNESELHEDLLRRRVGSDGSVRGAHQFAGHQCRRASKIYSNATRVLLGCSCLSTFEYFFPSKERRLETYLFLEGLVLLISSISSPVKTCEFRGCYLCFGFGWPWYDNHLPRDGWNPCEYLLPVCFCWIVFSAFLTPDAKYDAAWLVCWLQKYTG